MNDILPPDEVVLETSMLSPKERAEFLKDATSLHQSLIKMWGKYIPSESVVRNKHVVQSFFLMSEEGLHEFYDMWPDGLAFVIDDKESLIFKLEYLFNEVMARYITYKTLNSLIKPQYFQRNIKELISYVDNVIQLEGDTVFKVNFGGEVSQEDKFRILEYFEPDKLRKILPKMYLDDIDDNEPKSNEGLGAFANKTPVFSALKEKPRDENSGGLRKMADFIGDTFFKRFSKKQMARNTHIVHELVHIYQPLT